MIHADTSVLASRVFDIKERRGAAGQALTGVTVCICGYVIQELRATFLRDAAVLHSLIVDSGVAEAIRRFDRYSKTRTAGRMAQILAYVVDRTAADKAGFNDEVVLQSLEMLLDGTMMRRFIHGLQSVEHDHVQCHRADAVAVRDGDRYATARHCTHPDCGLKDFLVANAAGLRSIAEGSDELDEVHERLRNTASAATTTPGDIRTTDCYGVLADVIIALECPDGATLCTTNMKHSVPICEALGLNPPLDANPSPSS